MKPYYDDGKGIVIYHGDALEILPMLEPGSVDLVLTDPPYAVSRSGVGRWQQRYGRTTDLDFFPADRDWAGMIETVNKVTLCCLELLVPSGSLYAWVGHREFGPIVSLLEDKSFSTRFLVWSKKHPVPAAPGSGWVSGAELCVYAYRSGRKWNYRTDAPSNVLVADSYRYGQPGKVDHPTQKPLAVISPLILASSSSGDLVLDPFMGSGTTLRAAKDLGRRAIGIEISEEYCRIAVDRLQQEVLPL